MAHTPIDPFDYPESNAHRSDFDCGSGSEDFTFHLEVDPSEPDVLVPDDDLVETGVYEWLPDVLGGDT